MISFWAMPKAERFPSFKNGGDLVFGVRDPKENLNLNPLTLSSPTELAVGNLIYSSLLSYDSSGKLIGDLAESYVIEDGGKSLLSLNYEMVQPGMTAKRLGSKMLFLLLIP